MYSYEYSKSNLDECDTNSINEPKCGISNRKCPKCGELLFNNLDLLKPQYDFCENLSCDYGCED